MRPPRGAVGSLEVAEPRCWRIGRDPVNQRQGALRMKRIEFLLHQLPHYHVSVLNRTYQLGHKVHGLREPLRNERG